MRTRDLEPILQQVQAGLKLDHHPGLAPLVHWRGCHDTPIHRWFRYREAFSPELIPALELGSRLLDPFCGSGSIMLGAARLRRVAVGIDVNPLAAFVARVKLSPLDAQQLAKVTGFCSQLASIPPQIDRWPLPALSIASKVFEPRILDELLALRTAVEGWTADPAVRDFLRLAWLAILQDVGSYFKEGNGIKYRNRKRLASGYVRRPEGVWQRERFGDDQAGFVRNALQKQLAIMVSDAAEWQNGDWGTQQIIEGNTLEVVAELEPQSFDSIVFSPPYANRFDYFESMKVELWFGNFVECYEDMLSLRKRSVRSHLGAALDEERAAAPEVEALIAMMDGSSYAVRMRVPALVRGYFNDMYRVLLWCKKLLRPGGRCFIVVGNSAYAGVIIPTDTLLARLGLEAGFDDAGLMLVRHLTVAPQQRRELEGLEGYMRESVVVLQ